MLRQFSLLDFVLFVDFEKFIKMNESHLTSHCLYFLICEMGIVASVS